MNSPQLNLHSTSSPARVREKWWGTPSWQAPRQDKVKPKNEKMKSEEEMVSSQQMELQIFRDMYKIRTVRKHYHM